MTPVDEKAIYLLRIVTQDRCLLRLPHWRDSEPAGTAYSAAPYPPCDEQVATSRWQNEACRPNPTNGAIRVNDCRLVRHLPE